MKYLILLRRFIIFGVATAIFLTAQFGTASAQKTAFPQPVSQMQDQQSADNSATFAAMLEEMIVKFVEFKVAFISTVEGTLGRYFSLLAYILAWCIAIAYFIQQVWRGEWDVSEIWWFTARLAICLLLLVFCGDVNGDGKRGDIVRGAGFIGYLLAHGNTADEPAGNFIGKLVDEQNTKFNTNYDAFVKNKLMVKINAQDMPVKYPGVAGVQTVAAVYTGNGSPEQQKAAQSQEFWIGLGFQILNACRSIIAVCDLFLIAIYSFGILILSLIAPFMVAPFVNRDLSKRFTMPFFWSVATICIIFPALAQCARYFAYLAGNMALGTSGNPVYTYDPQTFTIIANGDPTPMIMVAVLCMGISILCLFASAMLAYALVQGRLVEAVNGLVSNAFASASSVGLGALVTGYSQKLATEAEKTQIAGSYDAAQETANATLNAQKASAEAAQAANAALAKSGYSSSIVNAQAQMLASQQSAMGQFLGGMANVRAEQFQSVNGALANFRHNLKNLDADEKKASADNLIEMLKQNDDATSQRIAKELELAPDKASLLAEQYQNYLDAVPVGGSLAKQFGITKDSMDAWMRTEGLKDIGQWVFGDPNTGKGGAMNGLSMPGSAMEGIAARNRQILGSSPQGLTYERADGTMVDAMTGQRLSTNVTDLTNPNGAEQPQNPTIAGIFGKKSRGGEPQALMPQLNRQQRQNMANLNRLMKSDPNFLSNVQAMAQRNGWSANELLNTFALETAGSFNPAVLGGGGNKKKGIPHDYVGLIQFGTEARNQVGLPDDVYAASRYLKSISPSQQLPYVEKYLKGVERATGAKLNTFGSVYAAVGGGSGNFRNSMRNGGIVFSATSSNAKNRAGYRANAVSWDLNRDGNITRQEFGAAAFSKLGAGAYFDADKALGQIRAVDPATARYLAKQYSADSNYKNQLEINRKAYDGKQQANSAYFSAKRAAESDNLNEQLNIAAGKAEISAGGLRDVYGAQISSSRTVFGGASKAAEISRAGSLEAGSITYRGSIESAGINYAGQMKAAEIQRKTALDALYKRNLATLVQSVGSNAAQKLSDLFERTGRGMQ